MSKLMLRLLRGSTLRCLIRCRIPSDAADDVRMLTADLIKAIGLSDREIYDSSSTGESGSFADVG